MVSLYNAGAVQELGGDFTCGSQPLLEDWLGSSCMFTENMEAEQLTKQL